MTEQIDIIGEKEHPSQIDQGALPEAQPVLSMPSRPGPQVEPLEGIAYADEITLQATQILLNELGRTEMSEEDMFKTLGKNLLIAARQESIQSLSTFLGCGVNANYADEDTHKTALMFAAEKGNADMIALLLSKGALVNAEDTSGKTPLDYAREGNHLGVTSLLKQSGAHSGPDKVEQSMEDLRRKMEMTDRAGLPFSSKTGPIGEDEA